MGQRQFQICKLILIRKVEHLHVNGQNTSTDTDCEVDKLTNRELEVLRLVAQGLKDKEIAERLFVNVWTIYTHQSNLRRKLKVNNRTMLITKAKQLRII